MNCSISIPWSKWYEMSRDAKIVPSMLLLKLENDHAAGVYFGNGSITISFPSLEEKTQFVLTYL
jgi:hypothetical protein